MIGKSFLQNSWFIALSSIGGYLLSLTEMPIGWMIGTLVMAGFLSFWQPKWIRIKGSQKGVQPYWRYMGQWILGIELGRRINLSILNTFGEHWFIIILMLLLSIVFALLSGLMLWRFSKADLITGFFGTIPGGMSTMPSIAEEVGANTVIVSIVQMLRNFLVVGIIPFLALYWSLGNSVSHIPTDTVLQVHAMMSAGTNNLNFRSFLWTLALALGAWGGYHAGKRIQLPAPWLVGGMIGVAVLQLLGSSYIEEELTPWWPQWLLILAQILIGASIGSHLQKDMFTGAKRIVLVGLLASLGLILVMVACALIVSKITGIPFVTAVLAFAPGGIAEMATTSLVLHADAAFVVAVQVLRVLTIFLILPPFVRFIDRKYQQKHPSTSI
jgi:membrane AbrB-like protein